MNTQSVAQVSGKNPKGYLIKSQSKRKETLFGGAPIRKFHWRVVVRRLRFLRLGRRGS